MWLVQRIAVTTKEGVTGILPGTKVTLIEDHGEKLLVSDGSQTFEVTRAQSTTDPAVAQNASPSDQAEQNAIANNIATLISQRQHATSAANAQQEALANAEKTQKALANATKYRIEGVVFQKTGEGLILNYPEVDRADVVPDASNRYLRIPFPEATPFIFLKGHPDEEKLANDDRVKVVGYESGVYSYGGTTYHAFTFCSK